MILKFIKVFGYDAKIESSIKCSLKLYNYKGYNIVQVRSDLVFLFGVAECKRQEHVLFKCPSALRCWNMTVSINKTIRCCGCFRFLALKDGGDFKSNFNFMGYLISLK